MTAIAAQEQYKGTLGAAYQGPQAPPAPPLNELAKALSEAQGEIEAASKDKRNPAFNSRYADLASIWDACRAPLSKHGLSVVQQPLSDGDGRVGLATTLLHASGQHMRSEIWARPKMDGANGVQAMGSCLTYLRRYSLAAVVGIAPDDDDGHAAEGRADPKAPGAVKPAPAPAPRANTVKHTGAKASPEAVKMLHTLRGKVGGLVVCDPKEPCPYKNGKLCGYHTQLAAFKDPDGKPVRSSKDLSPEQIANLIGRYEKKITEQGMRAAETPDLGAVVPIKKPQVTAATMAITGALKTKEMDATELCAIFGVDDVTEIPNEDADKALALVFAYGTERYGRKLAEVTGVPQ